jgi:YVTN family beta-propeller protein
MRRAAHAGVLLCGLASLLSSCDGDSPTASDGGWPVESPGVSLATAAASCGTPSHPGTIVDKVTVSSPWGVAVRDDGLAYFTQLNDGGVGITSTKTRTVDGFIPTGPVPTGIAFSPDGNRSYVANQFGDVSVIDVATQQVVGSVAIGNPLAVRVSPDGTQLFVATGNTLVYIVDVATLQILKSVDVGFAPNGFAVHPDGRILYVSSFLGGSVTEIDMFTGTTLRTFNLGGTPQEMALNRKGTRLFVANEAGYLDEIELQTGLETNRIQLPAGAFGVGVTPDDGQAYVTLPSAGLIQVFTLQTRKLAKSIDVGGGPRRIAFSQQGHIAAVTNTAGFITFVR